MSGMRRAGALVVTAVLGLGLAACGGGNGNDATGTTTSTTKATDSSTDTTAVDVGDFTGECADFASAFAGVGTAMSSAFTGAPGDQLTAAADYFDKVADKLPKEIRADFAVFAAAFKDFARAVADANIDFSDPASIDPEKLSQLEGLSKALDSPEVKQADANIQAYVDANCKG